MGYHLSIDLGTTFTAAAVHRSGRPEIVALGDRSAAIPTVVFLTEAGVLLTGEAAARRALAEPERVAREFKRRLGDPVPIIVGGSPYSAQALMAEMIRAVEAAVSRLEGGPPSSTVLCHPASWGDFKIDLLGQALALAEVEADTICEPEAAAAHYATLERVDGEIQRSLRDRVHGSSGSEG